MTLPSQLPASTASSPASANEVSINATQYAFEANSTTVLAAIAVIAVIFFAGWVLLRLPKAEDIETQKVRFAAATFTGIMTIFVFAAVLYYIDDRPTGPGKYIFEKAMTAMTPLIGVIVGYLFGTKEKALQGGKKEDVAADTGKKPMDAAGR